jgi:hypothetical protein
MEEEKEENKSQRLVKTTVHDVRARDGEGARA